MRKTETVAQPAPAPACLNCGESLLGDFCWRCGHEAADFHRPLRSLAADFFDNVLSLDSKLLRTLGPLLVSLPGATGGVQGFLAEDGAPLCGPDHPLQHRLRRRMFALMHFTAYWVQRWALGRGVEWAAPTGAYP